MLRYELVLVWTPNKICFALEYPFVLNGRGGGALYQTCLPGQFLRHLQEPTWRFSGTQDTTQRCARH